MNFLNVVVVVAGVEVGSGLVLGKKACLLDMGNICPCLLC
jgi:hypothetical protein